MLDPEHRLLLTSCPPIAELDDPTRQVVLDAAIVLDAEPSQVLLRQGDRGDSFHVVLDGQVEVLWQGEDGQQIPLAELGPGAYFGEQALLGSSTGTRTASVRTASACRHAVIPAAVFREHIAREPRNLELLERDAANHLYERVNQSLEHHLLAQDGSPMASVEPRWFQPGEVVFREGAPSDSVFLIQSGTALVIQRRGAEYQELSRMGGGQLFGELGVMKDQPRSATVIAETPLAVLPIDGQSFKAWRAANPSFAPFFQSLAEVYTLSGGRQLNLFLGNVNGEATVSTVGVQPKRNVVSTRILDRGVVVFANHRTEQRLREDADSQPSTEPHNEVVSFVRDDFRRELRVSVLERSDKQIERCVIHSLVAEGIGPDLGLLYRRVADSQEVSARELRNFRRTGYLGARATRTDRLCACLALGHEEIAESVQELGNNYEAVSVATGCGRLCGGCEPALRRFVEQHGKGADLEPPEDSTVAPPTTAVELPPDLRRVSQLLSTWDPKGSGRVTREEVAIHLRGLAVRDLDRLLDILFPQALPAGVEVPIDCLVAALAQQMTHTRALKEQLRPPGSAELGLRALLRILLKLRTPAFWCVAVVALVSAVVLLVTAASAGPLPLLASLAGLLGAGTLLLRSPSFRFALHLLHRGPERIYSAMFAAFGKTSRFERYRPFGPLGPTVFYLRDEQMIERVLHTPEVYVKDPRVPLQRYAIFGSHSILWGGTDPFWLGTRSVCEEYFIEGYQDDLGEMTEIVRERVQTWQTRGEIDLLDEIYRIILEIRARVFFQTTFHCFDDEHPLGFAGLIDRVLMGQFVFLSDPNSEVARVHDTVMTAVEGSTRPGSVGKRLMDAMARGGYTREEVLHNAVTYVVAQAPTMGIFWTLYRAARDGTDQLRGDRSAIVRALKEEMRLHPPVTSLFLRQSTRDDTLGEVHVPKNSWIFVCPQFIHTNPELWSQPQEYRPERWSAPHGDATEMVEACTNPEDSGGRPQPLPAGQKPQRYLPFGSGAHSCQGRWFATDEMLLVVATVLEMVELEVIEDQGLLDQPLTEQITLHVYNRPVHDVRLRVLEASADVRSPEEPTDAAAPS